MRPGRPGQLKCGAQMNVDDFLPLVIRHFSERLVAHESCIVDDGVESTEAFDDCSISESGRSTRPAK